MNRGSLALAFSLSLPPSVSSPLFVVLFSCRPSESIAEFIESLCASILAVPFALFRLWLLYPRGGRSSISSAPDEILNGEREIKVLPCTKVLPFLPDIGIICKKKKKKKTFTLSYQIFYFYRKKKKIYIYIYIYSSSVYLTTKSERIYTI